MLQYHTTKQLVRVIIMKRQQRTKQSDLSFFPDFGPMCKECDFSLSLEDCKNQQSELRCPVGTKCATFFNDLWETFSTTGSTVLQLTSAVRDAHIQGNLVQWIVARVASATVSSDVFTMKR